MLKAESQGFNIVTQKVLRIVSQMATLVLVQFIIMCVVGLFFKMGSKSTMDGWIETFTISPALSVFFYHYYRLKQQ